LIAEEELIAIEEEIVEIRNSYLKLKGMSELNSKEETLSISNDTNLNGTVNLFGNKQIIYCTSSWSSTPKYLIEIWIRHLFTIAIGKNLSSYIVIKENKFNADKLVIEFNSKMITKEKALISLTELIGWYKEGHKKIFPFECQVGMPDKGKSLENVLESDFCNGLLKKALEMEIVTFDEIRDHSIRIGNKLYSQFINVLK
jgi:exonuclease V gamma subunit